MTKNETSENDTIILEYVIKYKVEAKRSSYIPDDDDDEIIGFEQDNIDDPGQIIDLMYNDTGVFDIMEATMVIEYEGEGVNRTIDLLDPEL